jgi:hypothetical protein
MPSADFSHAVRVDFSPLQPVSVARDVPGHMKEYEVGAFAVFFKILSADTLTKVFPFILRTEFIR